MHETIQLESPKKTKMLSSSLQRKSASKQGTTLEDNRQRNSFPTSKPVTAKTVTAPFQMKTQNTTGGFVNTQTMSQSEFSEWRTIQRRPYGHCSVGDKVWVSQMSPDALVQFNLWDNAKERWANLGRTTQLRVKGGMLMVEGILTGTASILALTASFGTAIPAWLSLASGIIKFLRGILVFAQGQTAEGGVIEKVVVVIQDGMRAIESVLGLIGGGMTKKAPALILNSAKLVRSSLVAYLNHKHDTADTASNSDKMWEIRLRKGIAFLHGIEALSGIVGGALTSVKDGTEKATNVSKAALIGVGVSKGVRTGFDAAKASKVENRRRNQQNQPAQRDVEQPHIRPLEAPFIEMQTVPRDVGDEAERLFYKADAHFLAGKGDKAQFEIICEKLEDWVKGRGGSPERLVKEYVGS